jgi:hypothetical protein
MVPERTQSHCAKRALARPIVAHDIPKAEDGVDWSDYLRGEALFPWQNFGMVS